MNKELTREEARLAWAHGRMVEACPRVKDGPWIPVKPHSSFGGQWSVDVLLDPSFIFRLTPEPPAKKWRPWTSEEVPVGALIRFASVVSNHCWMITGWNESGFGTSNEQFRHIRFEEAIQDLHSTDNGKTWLPCGVEVEA